MLDMCQCMSLPTCNLKFQGFQSHVSALIGSIQKPVVVGRGGDLIGELCFLVSNSIRELISEFSP